MLYRAVQATKRDWQRKASTDRYRCMADPRHLVIIELLYHLELMFFSSLATCHLVLFKNTLEYGGSNLAGFGLVILGVSAKIYCR